MASLFLKKFNPRFRRDEFHESQIKKDGACEGREVHEEKVILRRLRGLRANIFTALPPFQVRRDELI